jgi:hypothetical protein
MRRAERRAAWLALVGAGCAVALLGLVPPWTQLLAAGGLGAIAVAGSGAITFGLWRAGWIGSRHRIVAVRWLADGRWLLADRDKTFPAALCADTRLFGQTVWLHWKTVAGRRRSMLLAAGDLPAGQLRTLGVRLRIEAPIEVLKRALPEAAGR